MSAALQPALFPADVPVKPTLSDLLPFYRDHLVASNKSAHTVESYVRIVGAFTRDAGVNRRPETCSLHTLEGFVARVRKADRSEKTVELAVAAIKSFFRWARENGFVREDLAAKLIFPRARLKLPDIPRLNEVEKLLRIAAAVHKDALLVLLLAEGGLKRDEVLRLSEDHFDLADPFRIRVSIPAENPSKVRTVHLPREYENLIQACMNQASGGHPPLFACAPESLSAKVEALGRAAGIARRVTPMTLRHVCAVRMLKAGRTIEEVHAYLGLAPPKDSPIMRDTYLALAKLPI